MAGTIICDYIRADANKISLNVGNTVIASINASGILSNTGSVIIAANGAIPKSALPAGSVLQVVQGLTTTEITTSSSTPVDTTIAASITPTSATSKILILVTIGEAVKTNGNANNRLQLKLYKNGSVMLINGLNIIMSGNLYTATALQIRGSLGFNYLDSPATTSALEYRLYFASNDATASVSVQNNSSPSTIILMEIAA